VVNGTVEGGNGVWDAVTLNWTTADGSVNSVYNPADTAIFGVTVGTVTLGANLAFTNLRFDVDGYTIDGGGFTLSPTGLAGLNAIGGVTATINAPVTGPGAISVSGAGTIRLTNAANNYAGGTTLSNGTLLVEANGALGSGTLTISGGILGSTVPDTTVSNAVSVIGDFSIATNVNANFGLQNFSLSGPIDLTGETRTITGVTLGGQVHFDGSINNGGLTLNTPFTNDGDYVAFLFDGGNVNTYTGLTTINSGAFIVLRGATPNGAIQGDVLIQGNGVLDYLGGDGPFASEQVADNATVVVNSNGNNLSVQFTGFDLFNANGTETIGALFGSGTVGLANSTLAVGSGSFSGMISDGFHAGFTGGNLTKYGPGTLLLSGANSYTGATTVNGGALILAGTSISPVTINNGSEFGVNASGGVVVGNGVTVVTANDGSTVNNAGLLRGGNNSVGVSGGSNNAITNSGAIVGGAVGFQGVVLSGTGNTVTNAAGGTITGDRAIVLTNATGENRIANLGTLTGTSDVAIDATAGGSVTFVNAGTVSGDVRFGAANDVVVLVTNRPYTERINFGAGTNTLRLAGAEADILDIGSAFIRNFTTLEKLGGGTWTLTGEGAFPGGTTVKLGNLYVEGNLISDVIVEEQGFLGGRGTITGNLTNFGTVSPGNSPGTITVTGNFKQGSKGTLVIEIAGRRSGQYDVLAVGGKASLDGTLRLVRVDRAPRLKLGEKITFLTAGGGVEGTFKKVSNPFNSDSMIQSEVIYGSNSVSLQGVQGSYVEFARARNLSANQQATAVAVDAAAFGGKNQRMVEHLNERPLDEIPGNLDRIAPEELAAVYRLGVGLAGVQAQNLQRRMDDLRLSNRRGSTSGFQTTGSGPGYSGRLGAAGVAGPDGEDGNIVRPRDDRWGVFLTGMGEWIRIGDTENARGYELTTGGATVGVDYKATPNFAVGVSAGYAGTAAELAQGGNLRVNGGKIGAYATYYDGGFYADAAVSGGYSNYETQRSGLGGVARGRTEGGEFNALVGVGYDWSLDALTLGALTSVEYTYLGLDGFTESGSLAPLSIPSQYGQSLRSKLGFKAVYDWKLGSVLVKPEIRAIWQHEYGDRSFALDSRLASGAGGLFTVRDPEVGRDSLLLGVGGSVLWNARTATYLYYDGELYRKESESHNISGGVRISF